jgi:hypothetical protein
VARQYTVGFENVAITAVQDLFNLTPAADKPIRLCGLTLCNVGGAADAGDAQEELLRLSIRRMAATVTNGTGGTTPTPQPKDPNDAAAGVTARANDATTRATTTGTNTLWLPDGWNVRIPYTMWFDPDFRLEAAGTAQRIIIGLDTAPADSLAVSGCAFVEEE